MLIHNLDHLIKEGRACYQVELLRREGACFYIALSRIFVSNRNIVICTVDNYPHLHIQNIKGGSIGILFLSRIFVYYEVWHYVTEIPLGSYEKQGDIFMT